MEAKKLEILMTAVDLGSFSKAIGKWLDIPSQDLPIW